MSIIATCGHELTLIEGLGKTIAIKDYNKDGSRAISHVTFCDKCVESHYENDLVLRTKQDENRWIRNCATNDDLYTIEKPYLIPYIDIVYKRGVVIGDEVYSERQKFIVVEQRPEYRVFARSYDDDGKIVSSLVDRIETLQYEVNAIFSFK